MNKEIPKQKKQENNKELYLKAGITFVLVIAALVIYEKFIKE